MRALRRPRGGSLRAGEGGKVLCGGCDGGGAVGAAAGGRVALAAHEHGDHDRVAASTALASRVER